MVVLVVDVEVVVVLSGIHSGAFLTNLILGTEVGLMLRFSWYVKPFTLNLTLFATCFFGLVGRHFTVIFFGLMISQECTSVNLHLYLILFTLIVDVIVLVCGIKGLYKSYTFPFGYLQFSALLWWCFGIGRLQECGPRG